MKSLYLLMFSLIALPALAIDTLECPSGQEFNLRESKCVEIEKNGMQKTASHCEMCELDTIDETSGTLRPKVAPAGTSNGIGF